MKVYRKLKSFLLNTRYCVKYISYSGKNKSLVKVFFLGFDLKHVSIQINSTMGDSCRLLRCLGKRAIVLRGVPKGSIWALPWLGSAEPRTNPPRKFSSTKKDTINGASRTVSFLLFLPENNKKCRLYRQERSLQNFSTFCYIQPNIGTEIVIKYVSSVAPKDSIWPYKRY